MENAQIIKGIKEPLENIPYHANMAFLTRVLLANNKMVEGLEQHIAVHYVDIPQREHIPDYTQLHSHNVPEINLVLSEHKKGLVYEITLEEKKHIVESPATIIIPAGIQHSARAIKGKGLYLCIVGDGNYNRSINNR